MLDLLAGVVVATALVAFTRKRREWAAINRLLAEGKPEAFLEGVDRYADTVRFARTRRMVLANKAAGYCYLGRFEEAWGVLQAVSNDRLPRRWRLAYYNNLLVTLLMQHRYDEAQQVYARHGDIFQDPPPFARDYLDGTRALYEWHVGDRRRARELFQSLVERDRPAIYKAGPWYFLGLAALDAQQPAVAQDCFRRCVEAAPNHWSAQEARKHLV